MYISLPYAAKETGIIHNYYNEEFSDCLYGTCICIVKCVCFILEGLIQYFGCKLLCDHYRAKHKA